MAVRGVALAGLALIGAGGGIWGDMWYRELGANVAPALSLLTQVTSRPTPTRLVVDSGRKTVDPTLYSPRLNGVDAQLGGAHLRPGNVWRFDGARLIREGEARA